MKVTKKQNEIEEMRFLAPATRKLEIHNFSKLIFICFFQFIPNSFIFDLFNKEEFWKTIFNC